MYMALSVLRVYFYCLIGTKLLLNAYQYLNPATSYFPGQLPAKYHRPFMS